MQRRRAKTARVYPWTASLLPSNMPSIQPPPIVRDDPSSSPYVRSTSGALILLRNHSEQPEIEELLPFEVLELVMSHLTRPRDLLAASLVNKRWNDAAMCPTPWESFARSMGFTYSRKAISSAYHNDWKRFFMDHRRLATSLLFVIPNVTPSSLCGGGHFEEQFQINGQPWSVMLLVRANYPAAEQRPEQKVSISIHPNVDTSAVSVACTIQVLSSAAGRSTVSRAQHVFLGDDKPLELRLPVNSAQLSDPSRGFLSDDRLRVAVHLETLEQRAHKQAQEMSATMDKWVGKGYSSERILEAMIAHRQDLITEPMLASLGPA